MAIDLGLGETQCLSICVLGSTEGNALPTRWLAFSSKFFRLVMIRPTESPTLARSITDVENAPYGNGLAKDEVAARIETRARVLATEDQHSRTMGSDKFWCGS